MTMFKRMSLWWQDPTDEELERACFEEQWQEYQEMQRKYAGNCPMCETSLSVGVGDYTYGRTCHNCGYHDFGYLSPEIELLDWDYKPNLLQRIKLWYNKKRATSKVELARALIKFNIRGVKRDCQ